MTQSSAYAVSLASPRRDSAVPLSTSAKGRVAWSREIGRPSSAAWPPVVLDWAGALAVATPSDVTLIDSRGQVLWTHAKQVGTPVAVANGLLYIKSKQGFLEALNPAHEKVIAEGPFPGAMDDAVKVGLFWPREQDFLTVLADPGDAELAEGDSPETPLAAPSVSALKTRYAITHGSRLISFEGALGLAPLLLPESQVLALYTTEVIRLDVARNVELSRFAVPLEGLADWSVGPEETYSFIGYEGKRKKLLLVSASGQEMWHWTDEEVSDRWLSTQPPIRAGGGRIYALSEGSVLAIENGRLLWRFNARDAALKHGSLLEEGSFTIENGRLLALGSLRHGLALADGSLLVTGNRTLRHLGTDGRVVFALTIDQDILSQPMVDAAGHIYVATATQLLRID